MSSKDITSLAVHMLIQKAYVHFRPPPLGGGKTTFPWTTFPWEILSEIGEFLSAIREYLSDGKISSK